MKDPPQARPLAWKVITYPAKTVGWNYLSIPKLQRCNYNECNYLPMLGLKLMHVSKRNPWYNFFANVSTGCIHILQGLDLIQYKMSSCQYWKSHCGDKTVERSFYLHNGIPYTAKMASLHWTSHMIVWYMVAPMRLKQFWRIRVNVSHEAMSTGDITVTKQTEQTRMCTSWIYCALKEIFVSHMSCNLPSVYFRYYNAISPLTISH